MDKDQQQFPYKLTSDLDSSPPRVFLSPKRNRKKKRLHDSPSQKKSIKRLRNNNDNSILLTSDTEIFTSLASDSINDATHEGDDSQEVANKRSFIDSTSVFSDCNADVETKLKGQHDTGHDTSIDNTFNSSMTGSDYRTAISNSNRKFKNESEYKFGFNFDEPSKNFPSYNANTLSTTMIRNNNRRLRRKQINILTSSPPPSDIPTEDDHYNAVGFSTNTSDFNLSSELCTEADDNEEEEEEDEDEEQDIFIDDSTKKTSGGNITRSASILNSLSNSFEDNDRTPVLKKTKYENINEKPFSNSNSSFDEFESENEVDFKLDSFGRLSQTASMNNAIFKNQKLADGSPARRKHNLIKSTSYNNYKKKRLNKFNSFSRTNSVNEDLSAKNAKAAISSAIDDANPVLELSKMNLHSVPDEIEDLNNLVSVNLYDEIYKPDIKLYLSNNLLEEINPRLFNLKNLTVLSLRHNNISKIPGKIRNISKRLNYLQLSGNKINWVPNEILMLVNLQTLSLKPNSKLFSVDKYLQTGAKLKKVHYFEKESKILEFLKPRKDIKSPIANFGNSEVGFKRFVGELRLNPSIKVDQADIDPLKILENYKFKAPKLSDLCLRKLSKYEDLTTSEIKIWHQHLSKNHFKLIKSMLVGLVEENFCYTCSKLIINSRNSTIFTEQEEQEMDYKPIHFNGPAGSILEYYDLIENNKLVPVIKEFCCVRCIEEYLKQEYLNNEYMNIRGYYLADSNDSSDTSFATHIGNNGSEDRETTVASASNNLEDNPLRFNEDF